MENAGNSLKLVHYNVQETFLILHSSCMKCIWELESLTPTSERLLQPQGRRGCPSGNLVELH